MGPSGASPDHVCISSWRRRYGCEIGVRNQDGNKEFTDMGNRLYVGNLPFEINETELR